MRERTTQWLEKRNVLFWVSYGIYFAATVLQSSMYRDVKLVFTLCVMARYISFVGAGCKVLLDVWVQYRQDRSGKLGLWSVHDPSFLCVVKYGGIMLFVTLISITCQQRSLLFLVAFLLAAKNIDLDAIFRRTMVAQVIMVAVIMFSAYFQVIPDLVYYRADGSIRHSLGFIYPAITMTHVFVIVLLYVWLKRDGISWKETLWLEVINFLFFLLTDARNGFLMLAVVILVQGVLGQSKGMAWERLGSAPIVKPMLPVARFVYDFCPVLLSALMGVLCVTIQSPLTQKINTLLSERVRLSAQAAYKYGIHWLGNAIDWIGYGGNADMAAVQDVYNFVDCSYTLTLFDYGIIVFAGVMTLLVLGGRQLRKSKEYNRCFLYFVMLCYCFIEPRLLELQINCLLFLLAPMFFSPPTWRRKRS